ncbi:MAG TPA: D-alanyl-D-alanine carboxypeptidase/D-alanyl-D-alanine-endopeptidase [Aquabacterium sp.]|uniref:D-alanyl-D-alanine carboxypeptidase/D-alanyl-D-alanine endopeptidase n=1 Tax=Aquabacterium sp. TaxID=1872578 RepID=UPI002E30F1E1|nr:D-alanyl-D-alanine carboxypeptidase/D-alanyl-D-alanine-endopeptidase [Aquabacterium sp.]HEX5355641.1 D-alanyl-D-alanine carboxypeptidase/D-alanyl-D-alanine-endopeptidase [Aquabacterium sp.]
MHRHPTAQRRRTLSALPVLHDAHLASRAGTQGTGHIGKGSRRSGQGGRVKGALRLTLSTLGATLACAAQAALPNSVVAALQAANVPPEAVSMLVAPVEGAAPARLEHETQTVRQMASVMKLFTTGAALNTLGPAFVWRTDVALGGPLKPSGKLDGPLYLRGSGDPSLVLEHVQLMMARWRAAGLKDIRGDILIDRQAFDIPAHDPAAFDGQVLKPYNAGPDALLLNHQAVTLRFMPDAARPGQLRVSMEPELDEVRLDPRVRLQASGACGDWREGLALNMKPAAGWKQHGLRPWTLTVSGPYPAACGMKDWPVLWQGDGPGDYTARLLSATWKRAGGKLGGDILPGNWPAQGADTAPVWQSWVSPPLGQVVRDINKFSNNVMARQLFLTLGAQQGGQPATLDKARAAVTQQVLLNTRDGAGRSPCEGDALALDNGSGLSRIERSSARCLGRWLQGMWAAPTMPEFIASLPISGTDGTARRLQSVAGRAHLKTGSLDGVAALAGYVEGESGHRYVVVAVINHAQADAARPAMEALVAWTMRDRLGQN